MEKKQNDVTQFPSSDAETASRKIEMNKVTGIQWRLPNNARTLVGMDDAELLNRHGKAVAEQGVWI